MGHHRTRCFARSKTILTLTCLQDKLEGQGKDERAEPDAEAEKIAL